MNNTKLRFSTLPVLVIVLAALFIAGCKKDDEGTLQEQITKVIVHLTGANGSLFDEKFEAEDTDFDGLWNTIASIDIPANTVFDVHIHVYDGADAIDDEIEAESNDHLFTYTVTGANVVISDLNPDGNGAPFGIDSKWTTVAASVGTVQIKLHHEPTDKNAADPGGEVDFDVTFPASVQ